MTQDKEQTSMKAPPQTRVIYELGKKFTRQFDTTSEMLADRRAKFTITMNTPDRESDLIETTGIDTTNFEKNAIVQWAHDYRALPVGKCIALDRHPDRIIATVEFATADLNPFAEQVYKMVKAGFLNACSIGFRPLEWSYDDVRGGVNFI